MKPCGSHVSLAANMFDDRATVCLYCVLQKGHAGRCRTTMLDEHGIECTITWDKIGARGKR